LLVYRLDAPCQHCALAIRAPLAGKRWEQPSLILITGANGFVGRGLCAALERRGQRVRRALRGAGPPASAADSVAVGNIDGITDWGSALRGIGTVIHLAARTHLVNEKGRAVLAAYREINVGGTRRLAEAALAADVRRFVFLSSIKVNGEATQTVAFTEGNDPRPKDAYGISKWEAEQALWEIAQKSGMEAVVLRAPLVYGPGVKGNFLRLMQLVGRQAPLPLGSVRNLRSLVYLDNLVDAIIACAEAPLAAGKTYLVSDGEDVSTPDLVRRLAASMVVKSRLLPCPVALLKLGAALVGKSAEIARLTGSLQVDSSLIRRELGWRPRFTLEQGLEETARWYKGRDG
jgi:nucleoside-diphosphate-sugar epimerase